MKEDHQLEAKSLSDDPEGKEFGTTFGAAHGAIAGGVIGSLAGPAGTVAGAVIGAGAGAAIGFVAGAGAKSEEIYWKENLEREPFFDRGYSYDDFAAALRIGEEGFRDSGGTSFEENETKLREQWEQGKGNSALEWSQAKQAARAAWERLEKSESPTS
ncbi:hypothetical protein OKA04_14480 [Luteolibacter flavescens]|uniref:Glycine zipper domain-containing protein n=1 Tax=Luteolibacter flavescens TaxID=1859460 RepID=A0ABT3FQT7_9BACT|nr:hypothetical protein [Luteolibacter flavescens]MCW1885942.1 hypothetical protein [Luteolibacter flavescens]